MLMLHRLLGKLRDPVTHTPFLLTFQQQPHATSQATSASTANSSTAANSTQQNGTHSSSSSSSSASSNDNNNSTSSLLNRGVFWRNLLQIVSNYISSLTKGSPALEQMLIVEYPRLLAVSKLYVCAKGVLSLRVRMCVVCCKSLSNYISSLTKGSTGANVINGVSSITCVM